MIDYSVLAEEYIKCVSDQSRIYMIEHFLKTYDATQRREVQYMLFPRQKDLCAALGSGNNVVTTKPRQAGITTTCGGFISCEIVLASKDEPLTILVIGNTLDLAQQMVTKIRNFALQFPAWIWGQEYIKEGKDPMLPPDKNMLFNICNSKELVFKNGCRVVARSSGPDASRGVGGVTWLIFDEAAFIENGKDVYASALPTVSTGGHIVLISTPNGKDQLYYETCRRAELKGTPDWNNFELVAMKWYQDPRYNKFLEWTKKNTDTGEIEVIKEPTLDDKGNIEYNQKHWDEMLADGWAPRSPWYVKMCQQFNNDKQKIAQELDVSFLGSDSTVIDPEFIQMQRDLNVREPDPHYKDPILDETWIWKPPIPGHHYLLAIDNSRGSSDDATAMEMIDLNGIDDDGTPCIEQVLEYNGKLTGDNIGELAYQYATQYNNAFVVVEDIGGYGSATILMLMRLGYKNLYYDDPSLKKYTDQNEATSLKVTADGLPGFHSSSVRFQMLSNFANMVKTNQFKIRSKRVCNELDTWVFVPGSRGMDHKDGCHDDTLTCLAMGLFVMQFSMNRKMEAKSKDAAMLSALITVNNRIGYVSNPTVKTQSGIQNIQQKYMMPAYKSTQKLAYGEEAKYRACMWLLK